MPITFIPEEEKEKKGLRIPFWIWWILIPVLILGPVFYFVFQEIPESEIVIEAKDVGLREGDLEKIENSLSIFKKELFKSLVLPDFTHLPKAPSKKIGRKNPFLPIK